MPQSILASLNTLLNTSKYPFELQFSLHKCPKPSWQAFWPPHNQANAHLNLDNSSLNKCPQTILARVETPPPLWAMPKCPPRAFEGGFPNRHFVPKTLHRFSQIIYLRFYTPSQQNRILKHTLTQWNWPQKHQQIPPQNTRNLQHFGPHILIFHFYS